MNHLLTGPFERAADAHATATAPNLTRAFPIIELETEPTAPAEDD